MRFCIVSFRHPMLLRLCLALAAVGSTCVADEIPLPLRAAQPAPGAVAVCPDSPLRLTFRDAPTLGQAGVIRLVDTATGVAADTIDLAAPDPTKSIGTEPGYRYRPVIVDGATVTIYPRNGSLAYDRTYRVTIDAGVFQAGANRYAAMPTDGWTFRTRASPPARGTKQLVVAADGSADFCTVQGAVDFVPAGNTARTTILIQPGTYTEMVFFTNKDALTFRGVDRTRTVIEYATNERFNPSRGNPFGVARPDPSAAPTGGHIYHRGVFLAHHVEDLVVTNLTIRNTTPQGGSQAEAVILNGTTSARAVLRHVDLYSYQDTLQINGQAYVADCRVEGDVDFVWGTGPCFFERCTLWSLRSGAYYTQVRNPATNHGFVFSHCTFEGAPGIRDNVLSRIGTGRFPNSEVVLLDCTLTDAVGAIGWMFQGGREGNEHDAANVHFWEYNSRDPAGRPVDSRQRLAGSRRLAEPEDAGTIANYRDPGFVLGAAEGTSEIGPETPNATPPSAK
jgi:pectin methylesterase-like acyl-CoA thioesterase